MMAALKAPEWAVKLVKLQAASKAGLKVGSSVVDSEGEVVAQLAVERVYETVECCGYICI